MLITEFEVEEESLPKLDALLEDDILVLGLPDWTPPTPPVGDWPELQKTITHQPLVEVNWINRIRNQQYVADIVYEKDGEQQHVKGPEQATMLLNLVDLDPISLDPYKHRDSEYDNSEWLLTMSEKNNIKHEPIKKQMGNCLLKIRLIRRTATQRRNNTSGLDTLKDLKYNYAARNEANTIPAHKSWAAMLLQQLQCPTPPQREEEDSLQLDDSDMDPVLQEADWQHIQQELLHHTNQTINTGPVV